MRRILMIGLALVLGCGPTHKQVRPQAPALSQLERIAVVVTKDGEFTVFDERARATGTPAVLFGLIGAAVASGVHKSADEKSAAAVGEQLDGAVCRPIFEAAFLEAMAGSPRLTAEVVASRPEGGSPYDAILEFEIEHCGFRLTNQATGEMAAFIELRARLDLAQGGTGWDDRETVIATTRATLARLESEEGLARREFESVLAEAGRRMANNLIYP